ncbi:ATP-dependent RNA helicase MRH4, mitochondrial [Suhomyces tanzawaensis NRRL Y-17324]|uniref:ATP-dependent RNA helicase n=1 Tax=Suhomyces tanzawaensis NRRL Y-17324 TaxID=984487 RepID=A0A1E4SQY4_9ASCO|nr:ATP-dependent RNA helicase MRH4, mitochondrial [Suhomyces tanzawaensis NRRL Y-17324]ODV81923.1 ATP-dependent RNA helicase MRH4, mitochondrial [Suhomyces tanzawaensis NRRL Y-17324]
MFLKGRPTRSIFSFGKFSQLQIPEKKTIESSSTGLDTIASFDALRIFPTVRAAMVEEIKSVYNLKSTYIKDKQELDIKPSPVQVAAIRKINQPRLRKAKSASVEKEGGQAIVDELVKSNERNKLKVFTVAAETGSGKTWAYLASVLSKLKEDDLEHFTRSELHYEKAKEVPTVRSIILLPTHELVEQVYDTLNRANKIRYDVDELKVHSNYAQFLSLPDQKDSLNLRIMKWGSGDPHNRLFNAVNNKGRIDVLVTTPSKIAGLAKLTNFNRPFRFFNFTEYCVIDEADTLMDQSWMKDTMNIVRRLNKCKDLILCSATIPKEFKKTLSTIFPDHQSIISIATPSLHKIPKQIHVKIIDAQVSPYNGSKTRCLAQALYAIHNDGTEPGLVKRIIIFVNEKKDVDPLVESLVSKYGHRQEDVIGITGSDSALDRSDKLEPFLKPAALIEDDMDRSKIKILVTTDLMARGLNFVGIKNVILMDLPRNSVDLVHRIGRTGRMRQSGRVFVIVDKKTRKSWIKGLPNAIKRGVTLG